MADSMSGTFITVAPDGTVTYDFQGHVHALGFDIDAGTSSTPPDADRVRWLRTSDGLYVAALYGYNLGAAAPSNNTGLVLEARDPDALDSFAKLRARPSGAGQRDASIIVSQDRNDHASVQVGVTNAAGQFATKTLLSIDTAGAVQSVWHLLGLAELTDADVAAAAAIAASKLAGYPADGSKALFGDATWKVPPSTPAATLDVSTANAGPNGIVNETSLYSFAVPGGTLGTNGRVLVDLDGDYLNNSGANKTPTAIKVKWGGTVFIQDVLPTLVAGANRMKWALRICVDGNGATNAQRITAQLFIGGTSNNTGPTTGIGRLNGSGGQLVSTAGSNPASEPGKDSTAAQTIDITVTLDAGVPNYDFTKRYAITRKF